MTPAPHIAARRVVVAGGGIAALEAIMALHDLGEGRFELTLVAPDATFALRPLSVAVPFSAGHVMRVPLGEICARFGVRHHQAAVLAVDTAARRVRCDDGVALDYDALILATGAAAVPAFPAALTFSDEDPVALGGLLRDVEQGHCASVAVVVPPEAAWALPAYELALLIARHAFGAGVDVPVHLVTPEPAALAMFGPSASHAVADVLVERGVQIHVDAFAAVHAGGRVDIAPGDRHLRVARVVALPRLEGRPIPGIPADQHGFVPTDRHGRVVGRHDVYAAGDGADFPVKQGGLATQQADAAARHIAAAAGAPVEPEPFRPVLRGMLLTGDRPRFLRSEPSGGRGEGMASDHKLWWPPTKVVGHYLSPWLAAEGGFAPRPAPTGVEVEVDLSHRRAGDPLALEPLGPFTSHPGRG